MNKSMSLYRLVLLLLLAGILDYFNILLASFVTYYIILVLAVSFFGFILYVGSIMSIIHILAFALTWNNRYLEEFKESFLMVFMCLAAPIYLIYVIVIWDTKALEGL